MDDTTNDKLMRTTARLFTELADVNRRLRLVRSLADQYASDSKQLRPGAADIFKDVAEDLYRILDAKD